MKDAQIGHCKSYLFFIPNQDGYDIIDQAVEIGPKAIFTRITGGLSHVVYK
jgi:hypothetical protein